MTTAPLDLLAAGVASFGDHLHEGDLWDPLFATPTQYGTAYYGWCRTVLAKHGLDDPQVPAAIVATALAHTADPSRVPHGSGFDRRTLSVVGRMNHRDFTWPPILKSWRDLTALGVDLSGLEPVVAGVDLEVSFRARPPSNWAMVWMSGEWLRMQSGLSPTTLTTFDDWLQVFFDGVDGVGFDLPTGMYTERGLPNAYDLFTRAHLTELLMLGYDGRHRAALESFLTTGLRRSLDTQLSDGSMASGYRSAGQTWVLGAQILLFTGSRVLGLGTADEQEQAAVAAWRAYDSLARWQRPGGPFSPVQNLLAPELRVGYEAYTSDGHYSPLALGFLASAIEAGFGSDRVPEAAVLDARPLTLALEGEPTQRGVLHQGRISVGLQPRADGVYDASGVVDLTFGAGRWLHLVSSTRHLASPDWVNPGLAVRPGPGSTPLTVLAAVPRRIVTPLAVVSDDTAAVTTALVPRAPEDTSTASWSPGSDLTTTLDGREHRLEVRVTDTGCVVTETLSGPVLHRTLLVPYLRDVGSDVVVDVTEVDRGVRICLGDEWVEITVEGEIERQTDLPYGFESRRGLCGLVRIDVRDPRATLRWTVISSSS